MKNIKKIALFAVGDAAWQGGIQYIINILNGLNSVSQNKELEVHLFKYNHQKFDSLEDFVNINLIIVDIDSALPSFNLKNRLYWFLQRKLFHRENPRIENYLLANQFDYSYPILLSPCNNKLNFGSWIADFQYHYFPQGANPEVINSAKKSISKIAKVAPKVVYSSNYCMNDGYSLFPSTKGKAYSMPFTVYIQPNLLNITGIETLLKKYSLPKRYIMVSNLFAPTKNHVTLFDALGILKSKNIEVNLVCTGNIVDYRNQFFANEILEMLTKNNIRSQVHLLGLIPRVDQVGLFRLSTALVQPSINEGWSTLVEEAKILGKQILLSNIPLHLEQLPNNPWSFEALNASDLANKIKKLWIQTENNQYPEIEKEKQAFLNYKNETKKYGKLFLEIAQS